MITENEISKVNVVLISVALTLWSAAMILSYRWIDKTERKIDHLDERIRAIEIKNAIVFSK